MVLKASKTLLQQKIPQTEGALKAILETLEKLQVKAQVAGSRDQVLALVQGMRSALEPKLVGEKAFEKMSQEELLSMIMDPANFTVAERNLIQTLLQKAGQVKNLITNESKAVRRKSKKYRSSWVQG
jgi:hypothetical protein